jgi:hypothetical protein
LAASYSLATAGVAMWISTVGAVAAGATAPSRGLEQAQLVGDRIAPSGGSPANPLALGATDVMAALVAGMAVLALAFLLVTFIRRRMVIA